MQGVSNHGGIGVGVFKDKRRGWKAESAIRLDDIMPGKNRRLSIRTSKSSRGVVNSWASVATHKDGFMTFLVFQDFSRTVLIEPGVKCTEKAVRELHLKALELIPALKDEVLAFYKQMDAPLSPDL